MEARASVRHVRITPQKARRVVDLIRGMKADEALTVLKFAPQSAGETIYKVVASAMANATHNLGVKDASTLYISQAFVDEGSTLKRFRPRAQGRAYRINKRTSHITICVAEKGGLTVPRKSAKKVAAELEETASAKPAAKKAPAKKTAAKKAPAKKSAEKTADKAPAKKAPAKKSPAKKSTATKSTAKKAANKEGAK